MAKSQLHQLLAIENDRKVKAARIMSESVNTFTKKAEHFDGLAKTYVSKEEGGESIPDEIKEIVTTVSDKIRYTAKSVIVGIDASLSKEETNSSGTARSSFMLGGKEVELSATALLSLEQWLLKVREVYKSIPTLDPARAWVSDAVAGNDYYETNPEVKFRTKKVHRPLVLSAATKEHPAQVELVTEDVQVGSYHTTYKSGRLSPAQKSKLLERIDELIISVKKARSKANQAEVVSAKVGKDIFDHINKDIV